MRRVMTVAAAFMLLAAIVPASAEAEIHRVELTEVQNTLKKALPGDVIMVKAGTYSELEMKWEGRGEEGRPVSVVAEESGKVIVTGKSSLRIYGSYLEVSGFRFKDGTPVRNKGALIEFRNGDKLASHCRISDCTIDNYNAPRRDYPSSYIHIYGRYNRVDHNSFTGKKSLGVTLTVLLNHDGCDENYHVIENNYFGYRPVYGSNGAETIRVGTSQQCMQNSRSIIRNNVFYRCNGEVEVISIKSCENIISGNVLYECEGVLALRHGDRNMAENNIFIGNGRRNTGGVRIVGEEQIVHNNQFFGLAGERFFSALALMSAVPNSLPNRYMQVKGCRIYDNNFFDCASIDMACGKDFERTLEPVDNTFKDNTLYRCPKMKLEGFVPYKGRKPQIPSLKTLMEEMGVRNCEPFKAPGQKEGRSVTLSATDDICSVVAGAEDGTEIILTDSLYLLEEGLKVSSNISIKAAEGAKPEFRYVGRKSDCMISICDGGALHVKGIYFNGVLTPGRSLAKAAIATAADMLDTYNLTVEECSFRNDGESGFIPVKGTAGTFAERVEIRGCHFEALSGDALNFAAELDDKGRYNADDIIIENCTFERILGLPVNIYRGGSDESTAGPYVYVRSCRFDDCCNKVRGSVMRIIGAQILEISDCTFKDSGRGGYSIRLDDAPWEKISVSGLKFENSGRILSNRGL